MRLDNMNFEAFRIFSQRLSAAGIALVTRWEATPYEGSPLQASYDLSIRNGLLSRQSLVVGNEPKHLESVRRYVRHHSQFHGRRMDVRPASALVRAGQFALVERSGYEGGVSNELRAIIIEAGGDEEDVSYALTVKEEQVLAYIPLTDRRSADAFAAIVHAGATSPVSREELVGAIEGFREAAIDRLRTGDIAAGSVAVTWQKLANFWRGQPPSKDK